MPEQSADAGAASLSGQLLARKGAAHPSPSLETPWSARYMGAANMPAQTTPQAAPQQTAPTREPSRRADAGALRLARPAPEPEPERKVKLTLRLDTLRHRRLRLAGVHKNLSLQAMLVAAVDQYLEGLDVQCACVRGIGAQDQSACADCPSPEAGEPTP